MQLLNIFHRNTSIAVNAAVPHFKMFSEEIIMPDCKDTEERTMMLLVDAGNAKSKAMEAVTAAKRGEFDKADALMLEATEAMTKAHQNQSEFIQDSLDGNESTVTLLMAHAEDHMMGAIIANDFAKEIIELYRLLLPVRKGERK
ncbi:MAG: PTS lactose/cellobiose transporter subunit IIA [Planctomycetes bacterium]|nr:PTS lactose/cellobiose transporter subunit IIA [Planctomycetota bacterium]